MTFPLDYLDEIADALARAARADQKPAWQLLHHALADIRMAADYGWREGKAVRDAAPARMPPGRETGTAARETGAYDRRQ